MLVDGVELEQHRLALLSEAEVEISANTQARCVIVGGESLGERHKWWNFVSSSTERIEQAKGDWQKGKFPQVPEETEFVPLPDKQDLEQGKKEPIL